MKPLVGELHPTNDRNINNKREPLGTVIMTDVYDDNVWRDMAEEEAETWTDRDGQNGCGSRGSPVAGAPYEEEKDEFT